MGNYMLGDVIPSGPGEALWHYQGEVAQVYIHPVEFAEVRGICVEPRKNAQSTLSLTPCLGVCRVEKVSRKALLRRKGK